MITEKPISEYIHIIKNAKMFMSPMSGITDIPFRMILQKYGCKFMFTEMIDVNGLAHNNKKTFKMLNKYLDTNTLGVQIVGENEKNILFAAKICQDNGFKILELNASCPVKKVVKDGKGSALLKDPIKLTKIAGKLVNTLQIPVSIKIRSGWNSSSLNYLEMAKMLEQEGVSSICIHPRTREQMYKGPANHSITLSIKQKLKIPVFASGDIFTPADVIRVLRETNCDAVAVARGVLGRPWFFKEIHCSLKGQTNTITSDDCKNTIIEHMSFALQFYDSKKAFSRMQKHMLWYFKNFKNRKLIIENYRTVKNFNDFLNFMNNINFTTNRNWQ